MLMHADRSALLIIDVQERLIGAIHESGRVVENCRWLAALATRLEVPALLSEQYPKGLGPTVGELRQRFDPGNILEKVHFGVAQEPACLARVEACNRQQWVLAGIESHVCVLQTALGLLGRGREVFLVADAVSSRDPANVTLALERMRAEGVRIVSREMVAFEWLQRAGTDTFRSISRDFLR